MDKQKLTDDAMHRKSHQISLAEKVGLQHAFKSVMEDASLIFCGRLFHNLGPTSVAR